MTGVPLPYDDLDEVRDRMAQLAPHLTRYGHLEGANFFSQAATLAQVKHENAECGKLFLKTDKPPVSGVLCII